MSEENNFFSVRRSVLARKMSNAEISEEHLDLILKAGIRVRPFDKEERSSKNFVYYDESEQISNALSIAQLSRPNSFYYPKATSYNEKIFWRCEVCKKSSQILSRF